VSSFRISVILSVIIFAFLCSGLVAALNSQEATVHAIFPVEFLQAGQTTTVTLFFTSTSADELKITNVGLHFDWMPSDTFLGFNLNNSVVTIPSGGGTYEFPPVTIQVPLTVTNGTHTYFVGIDGTQGTSSTPFSWDSPTTTKEVVGGSVNPTPLSTNSGGEQPEGQPNLLLYGAIAAVVVIVVLLIVVFMIRKKRTVAKPAANQETDSQSQPSTPEKKPNPEQDFNI
jgi:hypothetical protein